MTGRPSTLTDAEARAIARVYLLAVHAGLEATTVVLMREFGLSRSQVANRLAVIRARRLLPRVTRGAVAPAEGHWPRTARWAIMRGRPSWLACQSCRHPWPCAEPSTVEWLAWLDVQAAAP